MKETIQLKAIAAMSENRVIGNKNQIPWHIPEDFKWFKQQTLGHIIVMGRKTFESMGSKPLPGRETIVISRSKDFPGSDNVRVISDIEELFSLQTDKNVWICGGGEIYRRLLPHCSDLYLTVIKKTIPGDTFFPPFESDFDLAECITDKDHFKILHYKRKGIF